MNTRPDRIILGIDPGTNVMGYGLLSVSRGKPALIDLGILEPGKLADPYMRLSFIFEHISTIVDRYMPDEMAIEAPFYGKNVQSMLKLGRAQGVAMAAVLTRNIPVAEYEPRKIKQAITGRGSASKEQVSEMLRHILDIPADKLRLKLDATDALAVALCHFYESTRPLPSMGSNSWKNFIARNPDKIYRP